MALAIGMGGSQHRNEWLSLIGILIGRKYPAVVYGSYISGLGYIYLWAGAVVFSFSLRGLAKIAQNGF